MSKDKEFSDAFRKLILAIAPHANAKMTQENTPAVLLADWGRKACDILESRQPDTELVEALQGVVDSFYIGNGFFCPNLHDCKTHNCKPCSIFAIARAAKKDLTKLKEKSNE